MIDIDLVIKYNKGDLRGTEFGLIRKGTYDDYKPYVESSFARNPISISKDKSGIFTYVLNGRADVDIEIANLQSQKTIVFKDRKNDLRAGNKTYPWNLHGKNGKYVSPGTYVARFRSKARNTDIPVNDVCVVFKVHP
jgi:hypothetical protein